MELCEYMRAIGRKGGTSRSAKKREASRRNVARARAAKMQQAAVPAAVAGAPEKQPHAPALFIRAQEQGQ